MTKISMKAAWKLGVSTARNGIPIDTNPYKPQTPIFESWNDGWRLEVMSKKNEKPQSNDGPQRRGEHIGASQTFGSEVPRPGTRGMAENLVKTGRSQSH